MMYGLYYQTSGCYFWEEWYERSEVAKKASHSIVSSKKTGIEPSVVER